MFGRMKCALVGASAITLVGCPTLQPPIRQIAVDSNRVFAESADQQTFLNILRARDKLPMHFSSFRYFRGNVEVTGSASIGGDLVERGTEVTSDGNGSTTSSVLSNGVNTIKPTLGLQVVSNPNFETAYYDTKEFQSGILTPIKPALFDFYLSQGWPDQLLSALFISSVDIEVQLDNLATTIGEAGKEYEEGKERKGNYELANDPDSAGFNFGVFIDFFESAHKITKSDDVPLFSVSSAKDISLGDLSTLDGKKFTVKYGSKKSDDAKTDSEPISPNCKPTEPCIVRVGGSGRGITFRVRSLKDKGYPNEFVKFPGDALKDRIARLHFPTGNKDELKKHKEGIALRCGPFFVSEDSMTGFSKTRIDPRKNESEPAKKTSMCDIGIGPIDANGNILTGKVKRIGSLDFEVFFRSPQGVLYFLGQYLRSAESYKYSANDISVDFGTLEGEKKDKLRELLNEEKETASNAYLLRENGCAYHIILAKEQFGDSDLIRARHRGDDHAMTKPGNEKCSKAYHRGSQAMALSQQLINLHKSAKTLPTTNAIQIVP